MNVTVVLRSGDYTVHRTGCQHLGRELRLADNNWSLDAATKREVALDAWCDHIAEGSMTEDEAVGFTSFAPCLDNLPEA